MGYLKSSRGLILAILIFIGVSHKPGLSQENIIWFENGATWYYKYGEGLEAQSAGYEKLEVIGDTVVNNIDYRIINRIRVFSTGVEQVLNNLYLRYNSENDQVFRFSDSTEYLLYDFSVEVGDTIIVEVINGLGEVSYCNLLVDSIRIELFSDSIQRRVQYCTETQNFQFRFAGRIVEGIGSEVFLFPVDELACDAGCADNLRCFSDSKVKITSPNIGCDELITNTDLIIKQKNELKVFPNPAQDLLYIESMNPMLSVTILDLNGSDIIKKSVYSELITSLDIQSLDSGIYIIRILFRDKYFETRKLMID